MGHRGRPEASPLVNSATFLVLRTALGLTTEDIAQRFDVSLRTAQRWEASTHPPDDVADWVCQQWNVRLARVESVLDLADRDAPEVVTLLARRDPEKLMLEQGMSIGEHRALLGHVALALSLEERAFEVVDDPEK